jgi:hypothetical protein
LLLPPLALALALPTASSPLSAWEPRSQASSLKTATADASPPVPSRAALTPCATGCGGAGAPSGTGAAAEGGPEHAALRGTAGPRDASLGPHAPWWVVGTVTGPPPRAMATKVASRAAPPALDRASIARAREDSPWDGGAWGSRRAMDAIALAMAARVSADRGEGARSGTNGPPSLPGAATSYKCAPSASSPSSQPSSSSAPSASPSTPMPPSGISPGMPPPEAPAVPPPVTRGQRAARGKGLDTMGCGGLWDGVHPTHLGPLQRIQDPLHQEGQHPRGHHREHQQGLAGALCPAAAAACPPAAGSCGRPMAGRYRSRPPHLPPRLPPRPRPRHCQPDKYHAQEGSGRGLGPCAQKGRGRAAGTVTPFKPAKQQCTNLFLALGTDQG